MHDHCTKHVCVEGYTCGIELFNIAIRVVIYVNSMTLILKFNLTSLRNMYIKNGLPLSSVSLSTTHTLMYMFLNEVKFNLRMRITLLS